MPFYVKRKSDIKGPFTREQIQSVFKAGKLFESDLIASSRQGPWQAVSASLISQLDFGGSEAERIDIDPNIPPHSYEPNLGGNVRVQTPGASEGQPSDYWNMILKEAEGSQSKELAESKGTQNVDNNNPLGTTAAEQEESSEDTKGCIGCLVFIVILIAMGVFGRCARGEPTTQLEDTIKSLNAPFSNENKYRPQD